MPLHNSRPTIPTDRPTGSIAQTCERRTTFTTAALVAGRLVLSAVYLTAGQSVASITYLSGTAMVGPAHVWAALFTPSFVLMGQSPDDTSTPWAANTTRTFALGSPAVATVTGWHYVGVMVDAATPPTVLSLSPGNALVGIAPSVGGISNAGLAATAPSTATASTTGGVPYAYLS